MPNGKIGDHPYTDILVHGKEVYSASASALVREIHKLADEKTRGELADLLIFKYNEYRSPNVVELENELRAMRDRLRSEAGTRGFELE